MSRGSIAVPDVIGLTFATAYSIGTSAGLVVKGQAPDGRPVAPDSEGIVVEQSPSPPGTSKPGHVLSLRVGRGDGGSRDPEPRRPDPLVRSDRGDYRDPDADLELIPA
jgi:beta-lactam-binding protein with PASTA domain